MAEHKTKIRKKGRCDEPNCGFSTRSLKKLGEHAKANGHKIRNAPSIS